MSAQERGHIRVVEVVVLVSVAALALALVGSGLVQARQAAKVRSCVSNLRQHGIAIVNYTQSRGLMPPCNRNVWSHLAPYTAAIHRVKVGKYVGASNHLYRCPQDKLNPDGLAGTSYAFNCTTFLTEGQVKANIRYSPFSTDRCHSVRGAIKFYSQSPGDTYVMMDYWGRDYYHHPLRENYERLMLDDPKSPPRHLLRAPPWTDDPWGTKDAKRFVPASVAKIALPKENVQEWIVNFEGKPFAEAYHRGRINVLYADGHVAPSDARKLATTPPGRDPKWTALLD